MRRSSALSPRPISESSAEPSDDQDGEKARYKKNFSHLQKFALAHSEASEQASSPRLDSSGGGCSTLRVPSRPQNSVSSCWAFFLHILHVALAYTFQTLKHSRREPKHQRARDIRSRRTSTIEFGQHAGLPPLLARPIPRDRRVNKTHFLLCLSRPRSSCHVGPVMA